MVRLFSFLIWIGLANISYAQNKGHEPSPSDYTTFTFSMDNDVMFQTDYYYTQGLYMELIAPFLKKNPINYIFFKPEDRSKIIYGLSFHQQMHTPLDIKPEEILYGDRPYAGLLYAKSFMKYANVEKKYLFRSELDLGLIGPSSLAGITQYKFHELTDNHVPNGWKNQIKEVPIINYNMSLQKGLFENDYSHILAYGKTRIGTMYNDLEVGFNYRVGYANSFFESIGEDLYLKDKKLQAYLTFSPNARFVAYNATLQGNMLSNTTQSYVIHGEDVERIVYGFRAGSVITYKGISIAYKLHWQSPEFNNGLNHMYHSTSFLFRF
ncbi:lipid A deacylase LpxR family protein [Labilibacter marinus]|uniref:lipid A deacylase LpxR family protein n=1 Tax=Labilibacter marinus TaxID=1477105 RepID=UPI00083653A2|nr:lipid A deacylase LpxR family protein [Labilibacter marinus]